MTIKPKTDPKFGIPLPIRYVTQEEADGLEEGNLLNVSTAGWYFWDDNLTELHGPYPSSILAQAAWGGYRDQMDGRLDPPGGEADIIVQIKDLKDLYSALYCPHDSEPVHIHGLGAASNCPWSEVLRWWPFPTAQEMDFISAKSHIESFIQDLKAGKITCIDCNKRHTCLYAWDFYNTNGDCLAEK